MEKIDSIVQHYEPILHQCFPGFIKQRINALRKLQLERIKVELEYHRELQELELKYANKYEQFNEKRAHIVSGEYQPTEEESNLPKNLENTYENEANIDFFQQYKLTKSEEAELKNKLKGVPYFWLCVLLTSPSFADSIEEHDKPVLKYLKDIQVHYEREKEDLMSHTIKFVFEKNPYFTNECLTKKYTLSLNIDDKDPFSFEGYELIKIDGCTINWNPDKDVTTKIINTKQKNKTNGNTRVKSKSVERESFFYFFSPPAFPSKKQETEDEMEDSENSCLSGLASLDFELAEILRQNLVPKAAIYYTGDVLEDDDDEDEDEDDEDEDDDDDGEEDSDDDQSYGNDSLDEEDEDDAKPIVAKKEKKSKKRD